MRAQNPEQVPSPSSKIIVSVVPGLSVDFYSSHVLHCKYKVQNETDFSQTMVQSALLNHILPVGQSSLGQGAGTLSGHQG